MMRKATLAILALGVFGVVASGVFAPDAYGAQWYPFYGNHRPSYLGERSVVSAQPAALQVSTAACYPPATVATTPSPAMVQEIRPARNKSARWYPFYGYRQPSYLGR